ncbi:methyl-accepting chemotaxis protein [Paraferrimonas sp. SM1919]|uniref:methyl-accepting chemotaxis protein n=1 Tax=Paraferrimonas sp. SM1919 TaxID=2662263 RepID=UPI0013D3AEB0|nr:methyl-accepting chemotaxis protein [Paraferrimonas sp. SM1919]
MSNESKEYILSENELLICTTDLTGKIISANDGFIRVSGFSEAEILGSQLNILRHPDIPAAIYEDFSRQIAAGYSWSGIVKDKLKNGGYCWVKTDITPFYENGIQTGYIAVRSAPNAIDLQKAKLDYRLLSESQDNRYIVKRGKVVRNKVSWIPELSIKQKLFAMVAIGTISLLSVLAVGIHGAYKEMQGIEQLHQVHIKMYAKLIDSQRIWIDSKHRLEKLKMTSDIGAKMVEVSKIKENNLKLVELDSILNELINNHHTKLDSSYRAFFRSNKNLLQNFSSNVTEQLADIPKQIFSEATLTSFVDISKKQIDDLLIELETTLAANLQSSDKIIADSKFIYISDVMISVSLTLFFIVIYLSVAYLFSKDINHRLNDIKNYFFRLVRQDYLFDVTINNDDEISDVLQSLKSMKVLLAYNMENVKQQAISATQIKIALDNVSTCMMIQNNQGNVIYVNPSLISTFSRFQKDFSTADPEFNSEQIVGFNMKQLLLKLSQDKDIFKSKAQKEAVELQLDIGSRQFSLNINTVIDTHGHHIGYITEWNDRTQEFSIESEIQSVIQAAAKGDFSKRMSISGNNKFFNMLSENLNSVLEVNETCLKDVASVLSSLAEGDLTVQVYNKYSGAFGELMESTNLTVNRLKEMILQIQLSADTINTAAKEIAIGNIDLAKRTEKQARSLEVTSSSVEQLSVTVKQNSEHSINANNLAKQTAKNALNGGEIVKHVVENMSEINSSSQEIINIISVIDSIAFQTNILALNAAVEAARAGEQGRGFAVVATEVRNLAQRSATAAKEIKELINSSVDKIESGVTLAGQAGQSITTVVTAIQSVAALIEEISNASIEQSEAIEQVSHAMLDVDDVTQQNSALVEEGAAAASSLEEQVANLASYTSAFDTGHTSGVNAQIAAQPHQQPKLSSSDIYDNDWSEF